MSAALAQLDARIQAFEIFRAECRRIWKNADSVPLLLAPDVPKSLRAMAAVGCKEKPRSIGDRVLNTAAPRTLFLTEKALAISPEALRKVLIHEACHLGISGHGAHFREVCQAQGGVMSGSEARGDLVKVERKVGARFQLLKTFPREALRWAEAWAREEARSTGIRHRITY